MVAYLVRRLLVAVPVLFGISLLAFALVRLVPGDTVTVMLGMQYTEERAVAMRGSLGLDRPLPVQYALWLGRVARGDLGQSGFTGQPVVDALRDRLPVTLQLAGMAVLLAAVLALPLGMVAAAHRGRWPDHLAMTVGLAGLSVPNFWFGILLVLLFSRTLGWASSGGFIPFADDPAGNLRAMVLPAVALALAVAAVLVRMMRSSMLDVLGQDYIRMARAKGCGPWRVHAVHALRNALVPVLTVLGIQVGYLLGGSVVIESVFSLPGIGQLVLESIRSRDYVLLQGVILMVGAAFLAINLVVDLLYAWANPRIRYG
jgi:peptide/nickel transport system permease protein